MSVDRLPDWYDTVRAYWSKTTGFLLASSEPCITIRDEELTAIGDNRALASREPADLRAWDPPASWLLAVILCPGDTLEPIIEWVVRTNGDSGRVWLYLHPDTDWEVLRPWHDRGFPTDQVDIVDSWGRLHRLFGLALNDQVYADWKED